MKCIKTRYLNSQSKHFVVGPKEPCPWGYKTWVHTDSQTQRNKVQWLAAWGHVSASSQSLRFILSLRLYSSFITSGPSLYGGSCGYPKEQSQQEDYLSIWNFLMRVFSIQMVNSILQPVNHASTKLAIAHLESHHCLWRKMVGWHLFVFWQLHHFMNRSQSYC